jgi:hypothetical protein
MKQDIIDFFELQESGWSKIHYSLTLYREPQGVGDIPVSQSQIHSTKQF